jgi:hypothetical protein
MWNAPMSTLTCRGREKAEHIVATLVPVLTGDAGQFVTGLLDQ